MKNIFILLFTFFSITIYAQDQVELTFDVSHNALDFVWSGPSDAISDPPNLHPDYGASFTTSGYIYPQGTFDTHGNESGILANGDAEFPDLVIGKWMCSGWFTKNAVEAFANGGEFVITAQVFDITDPDYGIGTLTTYGTERADFISYNRNLTGGSGAYDGVVGQGSEVLVGFNVTGFQNFTFGFDMKRKAPPVIKSVKPVHDDVMTQVGESTLIRKSDGITVHLKTTGLIPGNVYTLWFVVFGDVPGPPSSTYATGQIIGDNGRGSFSAHLSVGDIFDNPALMTVFNNPQAEVHMALRTHGPAQPGMISSQIQDLDGGCTSGFPTGPVLHPDSDVAGYCSNIQVAIHPEN